MRQSFNELFRALEKRRKQLNESLSHEHVLHRLRQDLRLEMGCPDDETLCGFIDGEIKREDPHRWKEVRLHVRDCRYCQGYVIGFAPVVDTDFEEHRGSAEEVAARFNSLGEFYIAQRQYAVAELLYRRVLEIREQTSGLTHPDTIEVFHELGDVLIAQHDMQSAKTHFERALAIVEEAYGSAHPTVATFVTKLGRVVQELEDFRGARALFERALAIDEAAYGSTDPAVALDLNNLGVILREQGDREKSRELFEQALRILFVRLGKNHPQTKMVLRNAVAVLAGGTRLSVSRS